MTIQVGDAYPPTGSLHIEGPLSDTGSSGDLRYRGAVKGLLAEDFLGCVKKRLAGGAASLGRGINLRPATYS